MPECFAPDCNHKPGKSRCSFFRFPWKDEKRVRKWKRLIRRADKEPDEKSRICSCHFKHHNKKNLPEIYNHNSSKLFVTEPPPKQRKQPPPSEAYIPVDKLVEKPEGQNYSTNEDLLRHELQVVRQELEELKAQQQYRQKIYSVSHLSDEVLRMETGLPSLAVFWTLVNYVQRFQSDLNYYYKWRVECLKLEDQILLTLMKLRQGYTNLHLAQLFSCSRTTIANIVLTFIFLLHRILFDDIMSTLPSRLKNSKSAPPSFSAFPNCKIVIDCTDVKIATPKEMDKQKATYSTYRSMNSFKVLIGVAPNAVITYVSPLFPGSTSDKKIFLNCGLISHLTAGDLILADRGFLISDLLPPGVCVNIPPFLLSSQLSENEISMTKKIAGCRIHVERVNGRMKDFKLLSLIPSWLRPHAEMVVQLVAALVNLQQPLIKQESMDDEEFE